MEKLTILAEDELSKVVGGGEALAYTALFLGEAGAVCGVGFVLYKLYKLHKAHNRYEKTMNDKLNDISAKIEKLANEK